MCREDIFKEIDILCGLNHDNVLFLKEYFEEGNKVCLGSTASNTGDDVPCMGSACMLLDEHVASTTCGSPTEIHLTAGTSSSTCVTVQVLHTCIAHDAAVHCRAGVPHH